MALWHYSIGGTRMGPVDAPEIKRLIASGAITADALVWTDGMAGWEAVSAHFTMPATTPPPIPNPPLVPPVPPASAPAAPSQLGPDGLYIHAPSRTFGEAISVCFSRYVGFSGRASRSEFWFFVLALVVGAIVAGFIDVLLFPAQIATGPVGGLFGLATLLPGLAVGWRRLHDIDRSGWWIGGFYLAAVAIIAIVTASILSNAEALATNPTAGAITYLPIASLAYLIYLVVLIVFFCKKGTPGPNRFG